MHAETGFLLRMIKYTSHGRVISDAISDALLQVLHQNAAAGHRDGTELLGHK